MDESVRSPIPLPNNMKRIPGLVRWIGGKGNMIGRLLPLIPYTKVYVEAYGGAASVLFNRRPSPVEVWNDLNGDLVNLARVLQSPEQRARLINRLSWTLYALDEFRLALETLAQDAADPVDRAWAFFVAQNQGFSGDRPRCEGNWGRDFCTHRGMSATCSRWRSRLGALEAQIARFARVQIDSRDALEVIAYWDTPETTFYLDPPYVLETRAGGMVYEHEVDVEHHRRLVDLILTCKGGVVLSGYDHPVYRPLEEAGWEKRAFKTSCYAAGKTRNSKIHGPGAALREAPRTEVVWRNPRAVMGQEALL